MADFEVPYNITDCIVVKRCSRFNLGGCYKAGPAHHCVCMCIIYMGPYMYGSADKMLYLIRLNLNKVKHCFLEITW